MTTAHEKQKVLRKGNKEMWRKLIENPKEGVQPLEKRKKTDTRSRFHFSFDVTCLRSTCIWKINIVFLLNDKMDTFTVLHFLFLLHEKIRDRHFLTFLLLPQQNIIMNFPRISFPSPKSSPSENSTIHFYLVLRCTEKTWLGRLS